MLDFGPDIEASPVEGAFKAQNDANERERQRLKSEWEDTLFVKARRGDARKHANELFQAGKLSEALTAYKRCMPLCDADGEKVVLHANIAAVRLKQYRWRDALTACAAVHAIDPSHAKAWFRRAQAHRGVKEPDDALVVLAIARQFAVGPSTDLDSLEANVIKDIKKIEKEWDEKLAARRRQQARLVEKMERGWPRIEQEDGPFRGRALF